MKDHLKGILLILMGTISWGASGVMTQYLFDVKAFTPMDILPMRCLFASFILLGVDYKLNNGDIFSIWKSKDAFKLIVFGIVGMFGIQYTFYKTIFYTNAATATILQYLMPIVILVYMINRTKQFPHYKDIISVLLAMLGAFLLITKGHVEEISISVVGLFWGLLCAVVAAFYTLQPKNMIQRWRATLVIGWGMFVAGISTIYYMPNWHEVSSYDIPTIIALSGITVIGTALAFYGYLQSTQYLSPTEISVFAAFEPLSSIVLSILFLGTHFGIVETIGSVIIIISITMLSH